MKRKAKTNKKYHNLSANNNSFEENPRTAYETGSIVDAPRVAGQVVHLHAVCSILAGVFLKLSHLLK